LSVFECKFSIVSYRIGEPLYYVLRHLQVHLVQHDS